MDSNRLPRVLLASCGCAQAEALPRLVHNLVNHPEIGKHDVIVVATEPSLQFFERATVEKIIGRRIFVKHTDATEEFPVPHINLAEWADLVVVYPASANTIAKCAHGFSDSLLSNIVMAAQCPVYFGPTMNEAMYDNPITQENLHRLKKGGYRLIPREMCDVVIRATNTKVKKLFCSEASVLRICEAYFRKRRTKMRA